MEKIYQASTAEGAIDFINMFDLEEAAKEAAASCPVDAIVNE